MKMGNSAGAEEVKKLTQKMFRKQRMSIKRKIKIDLLSNFD
jgi:hypothetical protein